jgi:hypothetical protein
MILYVTKETCNKKLTASSTSDKGSPASGGSWQKERCSCLRVALVRRPLQRLTVPINVKFRLSVIHS